MEDEASNYGIDEDDDTKTCSCNVTIYFEKKKKKGLKHKDRNKREVENYYENKRTFLGMQTAKKIINSSLWS
jgi:hypothetical protein